MITRTDNELDKKEDRINDQKDGNPSFTRQGHGGRGIKNCDEENVYKMAEFQLYPCYSSNSQKAYIHLA